MAGAVTPFEKPSATEDALLGVLGALRSKESKRVYRSDWEHFEDWCAKQSLDVLQVRPRQVSAYVAELQNDGKAKSTIGRMLSVVREVYRALVSDEVVEINPAREIKVKMDKGTISTPYLTEEQARELLNRRGESWVERRDHLALCLLLGLGWRRSEIARMKVEDFDDETVSTTVKGGKSLTVGVPEWLIEKVAEWKEFSGIKSKALLPRNEDDSRPISGGMLYLIVVAASKAMGYRISPHGLRRTYITLLGERDVSLKKRQLAVGHSSSATTENYDRAREAAQNAPGEALADLLEKKK